MDAASDDSMIALATHFAQVQFRLKQLISAPPEQKEALLKDLEQFAFQACPTTYDTAANGEYGSTEAQHIRYRDLIEKLRHQLHELERCVREGETDSPLEVSLADKQRIVIEELVRRFDLKFGDLEVLSTDEVRETVEKAIHQAVNSKEEMVVRLHTQIQDLERYIQFLQGSSKGSSSTNSAIDKVERKPKKRVSFDCQPIVQESATTKEANSTDECEPLNRYKIALKELEAGRKLSVMDPVLAECESKALHGKPYDPEQIGVLVMKKTLTVMQILTLWQCGGTVNCLPKDFGRAKKRLRYQTVVQSLSLAVDKLSIIAKALQDPEVDEEDLVQLETDLHEAVSMNMADPLRLLLEHGLIEDDSYFEQPPSCLPWGSRTQLESNKDCNAWKVIMHYYELKNGKQICHNSEQMLLLSFSLQPEHYSLKKSLLSAIHKVEKNFGKCNFRAPDTKFRALICEGFNQGYLAEWFRTVATHPTIAEELYTKSSFLTSTRFSPAILCLERLKDIPVCNPVELPLTYYQCTETFY